MPYKRLVWFTLFLMLITSGISLVTAQDNLLKDPGFEGTYTGRGRPDFNFPESWGGWFTEQPRSQNWMNVPPNAYPHPGALKRAGQFSQSISKGQGTFTASVFQQVQGIPAGTALRASAWVFLENVSESNAQVRIGIGNNVGGNPTAGTITWSGWMTSVQSWQQISVDAVAAGGEVTVFIYATQTWPNDPNAVYVDDTSLVATGTGAAQPTAATGGGTTGGVVVAAPTTAPPANIAPFASNQGREENGTIIHVVQSGDTIAAISVAYGVPPNEILALNNIADGRFITPGQRLIIATPDPNEVTEANTSTETSETVPTDASPAVTEEVAQQPTAQPTTEPTNPPEPTTPPEPTAIPSTPTEAPPAPVVEADNAAIDPSSAQTQVCVLLYEDVNLNRLRETGEEPLAGGVISINDAAGQSIIAHETDGNEPFCFTELSPGNYTAVATTPDGYGLTTPGSLLVRVKAGTTSNLIFGAAQGVTVAVAPTADSTGLETAPIVNNTAQTTDDNDLMRYAGLIVFGLAGVVLVGGIGLSLLLRRR